ncbi:MAG: serine/threonine protein kinase [Planctomycetota bacterium]|jgi:serine/threonine-protein kinase
MRDGKTLHPKSRLNKDIDRLFREAALRRGLVTPDHVDKARALKEECKEEIAPWLHHCLIAQDSLTEKDALEVLQEINWEDTTLDEKVSFLRMYVGNMDTLTDIHKALLHGAERVEVPKPVADGAPPVEVERMIISYQVGEEVSKDSLSRTFQAVDRLTGKAVALRVLKEDLKNNPGALNLFLHGAKVVGNIDHPNVVPVYCDGVMRSGLPFIVRPLIKGVPLLAVLAESGKVKKKEVLKTRLINMFSQVANAVRAAHAKGVLHRRINPVNVLVGASGQVYVDGWDSGKIIGEPDLAKRSIQKMVEKNAADEEVLTGDRRRSVVSCLPPEIVEGRGPDVNETSDIYSLGAVLFYVLTASEPVGGVSPSDIFSNILQGNLLVKSETWDKDRALKPLIEVCRKAMAFEGDERYRSVEKMLNALYKVQ